VENNCCFLLSNSAVTAGGLFPGWEHFIPKVGTFYSHTGNVLLPKVGISELGQRMILRSEARQLFINKGRVLKFKGGLVKIKGGLFAHRWHLFEIIPHLSRQSFRKPLFKGVRKICFPLISPVIPPVNSPVISTSLTYIKQDVSPGF